MSIETRQIAKPPPGQSRIVALFSFRDDAHLVPDMLANIGPSIHGWAAWDDRAPAGGPGYGLGQEPFRRRALLAAARQLGADWILTVDPDERFERALGDRIRTLTAPGTDVLWTFPMREMHGPDCWRSDGLWANKKKVLLFPLAAAQSPSDADFHGSWVGPEISMPVRSSGVELYHLRMMTEKRRRYRRDTYAAADPDRVFQAIGYDYLCDPRGQILTHVPTERGFDPPHREDDGLWAPAVPGGRVMACDPLHARLRFVRANRLPGGAIQASGIIGDAADSAPDDPELALLTADLLMRGNDLAAAADQLKRLVARRPDQTMAHLLLARLALRQNDPATAAEAAGQASKLVPKGLLVQQEVKRSRPMPDRVLAPDALWLRWCAGDATISEGAQVSGAEMTVVVIGLHAPPAIARAVASLRDQGLPVEIVVVNSGGGDIRAVLGNHLPYVRLIEVAERLFVGAARNIGIDASVSPVVAFLADDCIAMPGWLARRQERHRNGADAVTSAIVPGRPGNPVSLAFSSILYGGRWPQAAPQNSAFYGLSYMRHLFDTYGYFAPGLRQGEDSEFNRRLMGKVRVDWAPEVKTAHSDPVALRPFLYDLRRRARRRLESAPFNTWPGRTDVNRLVATLALTRRNTALTRLAGWSEIDPVRRWLTGQLIRLGCWAEARAMSQAIAERASTVPVAEAADLDSPRQTANVTPRNTADWSRLAEVYLRAPEPEVDAAVTALRQAYALNPEEPQLIHRLVNVLLQQRQPGEATALAEAAAIAAPHHPSLWLATLRSSAKSHLPAYRHLMMQASLIANPASANIHRLAGNIYKHMGQADLARMRIETAAALDNTDPASLTR